MKRLLEKVLPQRLYRALVRLKNETLPTLGHKLVLSPFTMLGYVTRFLPDRSRIALKSGINVVRKMDYDRKDIYLAVDSDFEYRIRLNSCKKEPETVDWIETFLKDGIALKSGINVVRKMDVLCKKEPETVDWIETFLKDGDVLYDVGANAGAYSLVASKFFDGKVKVYAFEPAFLNFTQLCKNLALNRCEGSVVPLQIALSDKTRIDNFNYHNLTPGGAIHALGEAVDSEGEDFVPVLKQPVLSYRSDDLIKRFEMPVPNHIKIDVDGTEFFILRGMEETLGDPSVRSILLELNEGRGQNGRVIEFLTQKGFEIHSKHGANHIFVRKAWTP